MTTLLVVGALYLAKDLFLPIAMAALFTFLLAPLVNALQRRRIGRAWAAVLTLIGALGAVVAVGATVVSQLRDLSDSLPQYRDTIRSKLAALGGVVASFEEGLDGTGPRAPASGEAADPNAEPKPGDKASDVPGRATATTRAPLPVTVVPSRPSPLVLITEMAGPLFGPLGTAAVVVVLVLFLLIYLEDLRARLVRVLDGRGVTLTTRVAAEVGERISRYLLMNLIVNLTYGIPVGIGLLLLGIPNAFLWGLLATLLRFIPYLGPWLAAALPVALSFAISPGWGLTLAVVGLFFGLELICGNLIEPWLYGHRTGLSPLAIVVAAVFWTWLWGAIGLLLSVPLTLIIVVSGRYIPELRVLDTLFGTAPALDAPALFYHRLVSKDPDAAARIAEDYLERRPLPALYDAVVLPALRSLKQDAIEGQLTSEHVDVMRDHLAQLAEELPALADKQAARRLKHAQAEAAAKTSGLERIEVAAAQHAAAAETEAPRPPQAARVVFMPAGDATDALVGRLLSDLLGPDGVSVEALAPSTLSSELALAAEAAAPDVLVVGALPGNLVRLRHLVGRAVERRRPGVRIIAGLWDETPEPSAPSGLEESGADSVVHSLTAAADAVRNALQDRAMGIAV
ncbi:MAG: AI-2E family transporter [Myxococcota bacterium]